MYSNDYLNSIQLDLVLSRELDLADVRLQDLDLI